MIVRITVKILQKMGAYAEGPTVFDRKSNGPSVKPAYSQFAAVPVTATVGAPPAAAAV